MGLRLGAQREAGAAIHEASRWVELEVRSVGCGMAIYGNHSK